MAYKVPRDIVNLLHRLGWADEVNDSVLSWAMGTRVMRKRSELLLLNECFVDLIDAVYMDGCKWGVERGAYEQLTQEDAETQAALSRCSLCGRQRGDDA